MMSVLKSVVVILAATILLYACAVMPRVSSWDSPKRITEDQVFNAALRAGGQNGMMTTASDRHSGTMSFSKKIADGTFNLNVSLSQVNGIVKVKTTGEYSEFAVAGLHAEVINKFHRFLFQNLDITDPSEKNVRITEQQ